MMSLIRFVFLNVCWKHLYPDYTIPYNVTLVPFLGPDKQKLMYWSKKILAKTLEDVIVRKKARKFESQEKAWETRNETSQTDSFILIYRSSLLLSTNKPSCKKIKCLSTTALFAAHQDWSTGASQQRISERQRKTQDHLRGPSAHKNTQLLLWVIKPRKVKRQNILKENAAVLN